MSSRFQFIGGSLALDFMNTVGDRLDAENRRDYFDAPERMAEWLALAGLGEAGGRVSSKALEDLVQFRELLYEVFTSIACGDTPLHSRVAALSRVATQARSRQRLTRVDRRFVWDWGSLPVWQRAKYRIALDAADLLTALDHRRIRRCEDDRCGWLFIDRSRDGRRRWCSMADCGNRAKARRHYSRRRRANASSLS